MTSTFNKPVLSPTLVGRASSLTILLRDLELAADGEGQIVLMSGEAGIGKSRLAGAIKGAARAQGFIVFEGQCFPADMATPYAPILDLLRTHFIPNSKSSENATKTPLFGPYINCCRGSVL